MRSFHLHDHPRKACALVAATLVLPALAYAAGTDNGKGNGAVNKGNQNGKIQKGDPKVSSVPEATAGWVLVPFFGAVLLFSARHLFRGKAAEKSGF